MQALKRCKGCGAFEARIGSPNAERSPPENLRRRA